jgi:hypothetical protein
VPTPMKLQKLGGSYQLVVDSPADLEHIQKLDEALWMATSMPIDTLTCDPVFLDFVDYDDNGRVRTDEIREAQRWLFRMLADRSAVGSKDTSLRLETIDASHDDGKALAAAAKRILSNIGTPNATEISLEQIRDRKTIMSGATTNGDGVIPAGAVEAENSQLAAFIRDMIDTLGCAPDAGGDAGVNAELLRAFKTQAQAHLDWLEGGRIPNGQDATDIMVWGPQTPGAYATVAALTEKLDQFFALCALCRIDDRVSAKFGLQEAEIQGLDPADHAGLQQQLASLPLARPVPTETLDLDGEVNPAHRRELELLSEAVLVRVVGRGGRSLSRENWDEIKTTFGHHREWRESDRGQAVASLGEDKLRCYLGGGLPAELERLIAQDQAVAAELKEVDNVEKLILYQHWLPQLINNSVSFPHFYDPESRALVEMGTLVIDGRHFTLNVKVSDRAAHKKVAARSHICLMYVKITEKGTKEKFEVATAVTAGSTATLCPGKPGIFFTVDGREWDAMVVDLLANPVSLTEALKHPFKRMVGFLGQQWEKVTASFYTQTEKSIGKGISKAQKSLSSPPAKGGKSTAARDLLLGGGVAFAALGGVATYLAKTIAEIGPWGIAKVVLTVAFVILATTLIAAVIKLRSRNLSMILEASGWAVNSHMRLTRKIGAIFTYVPKHPPGARYHHRDQVGKLLKKIPAAGHGVLTWVLGLLLACAIGLGSGYLLTPSVKRQLIRFLGLEAAQPENWKPKKSKHRQSPDKKKPRGKSAPPKAGKD